MSTETEFRVTATDATATIDAVAEAVRDQLDANYGDTVHMTVSRLTSRTDIDVPTNRIGAALGALERASPARGLVVEQVNPGAIKRAWAVRYEEGES